jgi:hypothetical protein
MLARPGSYPIFFAAALTLRAVAGLIPGWLFMTRDTVGCETPAILATS